MAEEKKTQEKIDNGAGNENDEAIILGYVRLSKNRKAVNVSFAFGGYATISLDRLRDVVQGKQEVTSMVYFPKKAQETPEAL